MFENNCLFKNLLKINRKFVRLGEHNLTLNDGQHLDVPIARSFPHAKFHKILKTNDIAILYLKHDVDFTGNNRSDKDISTNQLIR